MNYKNSFDYFVSVISDKGYTSYYKLNNAERIEVLKLFCEDNSLFIHKDASRVLFRGKRILIIIVLQDIFIDAILYCGNQWGGHK